MTVPADARRQVKYDWERCPRDRAVSKLERLAYRRHKRDLATGHTRDLYFDDDAAARAVTFIRTFCKHSKGEWAGQAFELSRFQTFVVASLFGWKRISTGLRRFLWCYLQMARKQGKTTLAAAIALLLLVADREPGAEVYSAATKKDQARICFDEAARMVRRDPTLSKYLDVFGGKPQSRTNNVSCELLGSKFEPLAADDQKQDGLNIHGLIGDEIHAWKYRAYMDVLETASGTRRQPLRFYITTPGATPQGLCWELREYCAKVLEGVVEDDAYFAFIAEPPRDADWSSPKAWQQGNPNLGVTVKLEDLRKDCERARNDVTKVNPFLRYKCGIWTSQADRWLDLRKWDLCGGPIDLELLAGRSCFGGLDLSQTIDLTSFALLFPPGEDLDFWTFLWWAWCPRDRIPHMPREQRNPYEQWLQSGHLIGTPGDVIDYDLVRQTVNEVGELYVITEIAYDPWNATQLVNKLEEEDGFTMVRLSQGTAGMNAPSKEFHRLIEKGQLRHGDNPVARWCASNISIWTDPNGNIKPSRKSSGGRIDLMLAAIDALARGMLVDNAIPGYEQRGLA